MATVKGQNLRIIVNNKVVASALTSTFHIAAAVQQQSTKDDTDDFASNEIVSISWDGSVEALVAEASLIGQSTADMLDLEGQEVDVVFSVTGGENNAVRETLMLAGRAVLTDIRLTAQNRQFATYACQITGTSDLTRPATVTPSFNLPITSAQLKALTNPTLTFNYKVSDDDVIRGLIWVTSTDIECHVHKVGTVLKVTDGDDDFATIENYNNSATRRVTGVSDQGPTWKAIKMA